MDYRKFILDAVISFLKEKGYTYLQKYKKQLIKIHGFIEVAFPELQAPLPAKKLEAATKEFEAGTVEE